MTTTAPQPTAPPPSPRFQFGLRTLLLLFVVLGSSLAVFGGWGVVVFGLEVGLAIYFHRAKSLGLRGYSALVLLGLGCLVALLMPGVKSTHEAGLRQNCANRLHELALMLKDYHDTFGHFPPAYTADKTGRPLHSWRMLIRLFFNSDSIYFATLRTEPWDAPKNRTRSAVFDPDYACPSDVASPPSSSGQTNYLAVVGPNAAWTGDKPRKLDDFGKDASRTIMLVEVARSGIHWAEPKDFSLDTLGATDGKSPAMALTSAHGQRQDFFFTYDCCPGVHVATVDGNVHFLRTANRSPEELRRVLQIGGFTEPEMGDEGNLYGETRRLNWPNIAALAVWLLSVGTLLTRAVRSRKVRSAPPALPTG